MEPNRLEEKRVSIPIMLAKLDELFNREEHVKKEIKKLMIVYEQLQEDKEMLENMIMYQSNKTYRIN